MRPARIAGKKPPTNPISRANSSERATMPGVRSNEKASSENDWKLVVDTVTAVRKLAATSPTRPPSSASSSDSARTAVRIAPR
jgi:hypothetical protein